MAEPAVIPIADLRYRAAVPAVPSGVPRAGGRIDDKLGRTLRDLRISVTDRCNFRCGYCMPRAAFGRDHAFLPQSSLLSFEEIVSVARAFVAHGVRKLRLTGGEPLLRRGLPDLVAMLAALRTPDGAPLDLAMTTNGMLLARRAAALRAAGLTRVTVSLDALDDAVFRRMNDVDAPVADVLAGLAAAQDAGFTSVKVNMVVQRGINDDQIVPMAGHLRGRGIALRFIEYMDVGASNGWRLDQVLPAREIVDRVAVRWPLQPLPPQSGGETAQRWRYADGAGEIGVIASVTQPFCGDCNRARISTEGRLYTCLFAEGGHDLRALLRGGVDDAGLEAVVGALWSNRSDRYSALRGSQRADAPAHAPGRIEMSYIGG